jgi:hypothetical protein
MILQALLFCDTLNTYAFKLKVLKDKLDKKTFDNDYFNNNK